MLSARPDPLTVSNTVSCCTTIALLTSLVSAYAHYPLFPRQKAIKIAEHDRGRKRGKRLLNQLVGLFLPWIVG